MTYEEILKLTEEGVEIWKPVVGYEGYYEISNFGRIKSLERNIERNNHVVHIKAKIKKHYINNTGYCCISLCKNGKRELKSIHRLLATAFIPNPGNKPEIDHINTDRSDYRLKNLRWVTHKENTNNINTLQNRRENIYIPEVVKRGVETRKKLKCVNGAKTIYQYTKDGILIAEYSSMEEAKRKIGAGHICEVLDNTSRTSGGFIWMSAPTENLKYTAKTRNAKAIQQIDMNGKLIKEWSSICEAAKEIGININTITRNIKNPCSTKYRFKYKEGT